MEFPKPVTDMSIDPLVAILASICNGFQTDSLIIHKTSNSLSIDENEFKITYFRCFTSRPAIHLCWIDTSLSFLYFCAYNHYNIRGFNKMPKLTIALKLIDPPPIHILPRYNNER